MQRNHLVKKAGLLGVFFAFSILGLLFLQQTDPESYRTHPLPQMSCVSYDPFFHFSHFDYRDRSQTIKPEWVHHDLGIISHYSHCIRIYTTLYGMTIVPAIAREYHIQVIAGSEIDDDQDVTRKDIAQLIDLANHNDNITHLLVGNEVLLASNSKTRKTVVTPEELYYLIDNVRKQVNQPVSTGEPFYIWGQHPEATEHVDFIAAHIFPYWEGIREENRIAWVAKTYHDLQAAFPGKDVIIAETGWPSSGSSARGADPDKWSAYRFLRQLNQRSKVDKFFYVVAEAFDQPWKQNFREGQVGAHWGLFRVNGKSKFINDTVSLGFVTLTYYDLITLLLGLAFFLAWMNPRTPFTLWEWVVAPVLSLLLSYLCVTVLGAIIEEYIYLHPLALAVLAPAGIIMIINLVYKIRITLDVLSQAQLDRQFEKKQGTRSDQPFISVHIPCRNEQPEQVIACIESVIEQNYEHFEVVVVDNNTTDPALWRPIEEFSHKHPHKVKFFHVENMRGFKAGALKYALEKTSPKATVIGVLDADYVVNKNWLHDCSRYLTGKVAAVQAPQDYQDTLPTLFMRTIYDEYRGFFQVAMIQRNESNAIVQQGTMALIERAALVKAGGWHTDTIVEDADLGIRLLMEGYEGIYVNRSYGKGRLPVHFAEYRKQRFRWSYGATRILIKYWKYFFLNKGKRLSLHQRMHFVLGWLPWVGNIFYPFLVAVGIILSIYCTIDDRYVLTAVLFSPILLYVLIDSFCTSLAYRRRLELSSERILFSLVAGVSLTWTIAHGVFTGIFRRHYPFKITYKGERRKNEHTIVKSFLAPAIAIPVTTAMITLGYAEYFFSEYDTITLDLRLWILLLIVVAIPGIACAFMILFERFRLGQPAAIKLLDKTSRGKFRLSPDAYRLLGLVFTAIALTTVAMCVTSYLLGSHRDTAAFFDQNLTLASIPYYDPLTSHQGDLLATFMLAVFLLFFTGSRVLGTLAFILFYAGNLLKIYVLREHFTHYDMGNITELCRGVDWPARMALLGAGVLLLVMLRYSVSRRLMKTRLAVIASLVLFVGYSLYTPEDTLETLWADGWIRQTEADPYNAVLSNGPVMAIFTYELDYYKLLTAMKSEPYTLPAHPEADFRSVPAAAIKDKPNIYVLMLESYLDPYYFHNLRFNIPPVHGMLASEIAGHNTSAFYTIRDTAAAEFEVLCGLPNQQNYSSQIFNLLLKPDQTLNCLPHYLQKLGYETIASHPNTASMYNRGNAYPIMGFEHTYFSSSLDMRDQDSIWLNDRSFLEQNLAMVKQQLRKHRPFFNYVMTVGGHYPYQLNPKRTPMLQTTPAINSLGMKSLQLSYYTADAVNAYITSLRKLDPGAVIIIMGDHFPYVINSDDALIAWEKDHEHDTPSFIPVHHLYNLEHQTFGMILYKGNVVPQPNFEQFEVPDILTNILTGGTWCKNHHCLFKQPFMLIGKEVLDRANPTHAYCDVKPVTGAPGMARDLDISGSSDTPAVSDVLPIPDTSDNPDSMGYIKQLQCTNARRWQRDYLLLYQQMLYPFFN